MFGVPAITRPLCLGSVGPVKTVEPAYPGWCEARDVALYEVEYEMGDVLVGDVLVGVVAIILPPLLLPPPFEPLVPPTARTNCCPPFLHGARRPSSKEPSSCGCEALVLRPSLVSPGEDPHPFIVWGISSPLLLEGTHRRPPPPSSPPARILLSVSSPLSPQSW